MAKSPSMEIKVGIFVFIAILLLAYLTTLITRDRIITRDTYTVHADFENVSGLRTNSPVEIAGIDIGTVQEISLVNHRARVSMVIRENITIYADSRATIRTRGVLGDKFVEINPGSSQQPALEDGGVVAQGVQPTDLDQVMARIGDIADDISEVTRSVSNVFGGPEGERDMREFFENLRMAAVQLNQVVQTNAQGVEMIVSNLENFSGDLQHISQDNKENINQIIENFATYSNQLNITLSRIGDILETVQHGEGPVTTLLEDRQMSEDLRRTATSLESLTRKLDEGEGTLGKLITEDDTGRKIDDALDGINEFLDRFDRFQTVVDFRSEYMARTGDMKSYLNLTLQPAEDRFYLLSLVDDPKGRTRITDTTTRKWVDSEFQREVREREEKTQKDRIKFSAQLAKRWNNFILRGGLIESTGGFGMDYFLWDERIKLYTEFFDLGADRPHLKSGANLYFLDNFYLTAGFDDYVSRRDSSFFAGLGFYFTDEDLKFFMTSVPLPDN